MFLIRSSDHRSPLINNWGIYAVLIRSCVEETHTHTHKPVQLKYQDDIWKGHTGNREGRQDNENLTWFQGKQELQSNS